jgi:hypothetical protein
MSGRSFYFGKRRFSIDEKHVVVNDDDLDVYHHDYSCLVSLINRRIEDVA